MSFGTLRPPFLGTVRKLLSRILPLCRPLSPHAPQLVQKKGDAELALQEGGHGAVDAGVDAVEGAGEGAPQDGHALLR